MDLVMLLYNHSFLQDPSSALPFSLFSFSPKIDSCSYGFSCKILSVTAIPFKRFLWGRGAGVWVFLVLFLGDLVSGEIQRYLVIPVFQMQLHQRKQRTNLSSSLLCEKKIQLTSHGGLQAPVVLTSVLFVLA